MRALTYLSPGGTADDCWSAQRRHRCARECRSGGFGPSFALVTVRHVPDFRALPAILVRRYIDKGGSGGPVVSVLDARRFEALQVEAQNVETVVQTRQRRLTGVSHYLSR